MLTILCNVIKAHFMFLFTSRLPNKTNMYIIYNKIKGDNQH